MKICSFEYVMYPVSPQERALALVGLIPDQAEYLEGSLKPNPSRIGSNRYAKGMALEFNCDDPPRLDGDLKPNADQSDQSALEKQLTDFVVGAMFERITLHYAGLNRSGRPSMVTVSSLKECLKHWLASGYVGEIECVFGEDESIAGPVLTLRFDVPINGEPMVEVMAQADRSAFTEDEGRMLVAIEDAARQLQFLREEQPVLTGT